MFSDTGNMSPIIVENMVMANIIVTPERGKENVTKAVETIILGRSGGSLLHPFIYTGGKFK